MRARRSILVVTIAAVIVWAGPVSAAQAATTQRVSVSSQGTQGHKGSSVVAITPDGRYVLFNSDSGDLIPPDHNHCSDVFVRDRVAHKTVRVSARTDGVGANGCSYGGAITPDGRYVVFASDAINVVPGPDTNGHFFDVFIRDRKRGRTTRVSVRTDGRQFPESSGVSNVSVTVEMQVSDDGRFVSFSAEAGFNFHAYVRDRARHVTIRLLRHRINALPFGMSPKGQYIAIGVGGSFDEAHALILRDIAHSRSIKISTLLPSFALPYTAPVFITPLARHVAFTAGRHAYVYTRPTNQAAVVPTPNGRRNAALAAGLSSDGRYACVVALDPTTLGVYRYDMTTATPPIRADILSTGAASTKTWVLGAAMNGDGTVIGFSTDAAGVPTDTNQRRDAYVRLLP